MKLSKNQMADISESYCAVRMKYLCEYKFLARTLTKFRMVFDDVFFAKNKNWPHKWEYFLQTFKLKETFDMDLKIVSNSTLETLSDPEIVPAPKNLEQFLKSDNQKKMTELKKLSSVIDKTNIVQDSYFLYDKSNVVKRSFITTVPKGDI